MNGRFRTKAQELCRREGRERTEFAWLSYSEGFRIILAFATVETLCLATGAASFDIWVDHRVVMIRIRNHALVVYLCENNGFRGGIRLQAGSEAEVIYLGF